MLDKSYIGGGGSGRNTSILRSNYLTPEGVRFYDRSVKLYEHLAADLNFNVMFSQRGHLTLAHNDASMRTMRWRTEVNKLQGVESEVIGPDEVKELVPVPRHLDRDPLSDPRRAVPPAGRRWSATTPWCGATPAPPTRTACTSTRRPRSPGSTSSAGGSPACRPTAGGSRRRWS